MALPFGPYEGQDLTSYEEGNKFLPRQFYSLNTTPSTELASTVGNTGGVTNTSAAYPYIWPPQGGGGGGGGNFNNKFGLNMDTEKTIQQGKWVGNEYVKTPRKIAQTEGGIWKDVLTNQNVYHGGFNVKTPMTMLLNKLTGKTTTGDPYKDTWYGHGEWDDEEMNIGDRRTIPQNMIQRWQENREIKKQEKIAADKAATDAAAAQTLGPNNPLIGKIDHTGGGITREPGSVVEGAPTHSTRDDLMAEGGRIGYKERGFVDPEEPGENIFEIMQDQNIPFGEQVQGDHPFDIRIQELMGKGLSYEDAYDIAHMEFQDLFAQGSEQDQGIAGLV